MRRALAPLLAIALVWSLASCSSDSGDGATSGKTTTSAKATDATTTEAGSGDTTTAAGGHQHSGGVEIEGTKVLQYWIRGDQIATGANGVDESTNGLASGALDRLFEGPTQADSISGMATMIPKGTKLLGLDVDDGLATVDVSKEFVEASTSPMHLRAAQVVFTLTQFDAVKKVTFHVEGEEPDSLGTEKLPTTYDGRTAFEDVTPAILIETPTPYQNVAAPIRVTGMSNTFEGVINWSVSTTEGSLLKAGTAKATSGTGTWGTFDFRAEVPAYKGNVVVSLWETGGDTSSDRTNVYEVLVNLT